VTQRALYRAAQIALVGAKALLSWEAAVDEVTGLAIDD